MSYKTIGTSLLAIIIAKSYQYNETHRRCRLTCITRTGLIIAGAGLKVSSRRFYIIFHALPIFRTKDVMNFPLVTDLTSIIMKISYDITKSLLNYRTAVKQVNTKYEVYVLLITKGNLRIPYILCVSLCPYSN